MNRALVLVFSATLLISAFLLFVIQPMFSKMILPLLGGTPQVWNTAMLFFQVCLLAGYAYAHLSARLLDIRVQSLVHLLLLGVFATILPFGIPESWYPQENDIPAIWQLSVMALVIGGPFFVLAGSAPLLQHWFAHTDHQDSGNPYFLYAASNIGSVGALIAYPLIIEPAFTLPDQSELWMQIYLILIALVLLSAVFSYLSHSRTEIVSAASQESIDWKRRAKWLGLAFLPSSLMLGVTTYLTTDIASVPLLWVMPLALYISTFIIVFARRQIFSMSFILTAHLVFLVLILALSTTNIFLPIYLKLPLHLAAMFFSVLLCHKVLADDRPAAGNLTEFYMIMSLGGALGGIFNALIAPLIFVIPLEYGLVLALTALARPQLKSRAPMMYEKVICGLALLTIIIIWATRYFQPEYTQAVMGILLVCLLIFLIFLMDRKWLLAGAIIPAFLISLPGVVNVHSAESQVLHQSRNFFGVSRVVDYPESGIRRFLHGTTLHGIQSLDEDHRLEVLGYYTPESGLGNVVGFFDGQPAPQQFGVLGLGAGVTACFDMPGRNFDFFEIDPAVVEIAKNPDLFTFLSDCGSPYEVYTGDGRLQLLDRPDNFYDLLAMDAFSSDSIPVHLLTIEALEIYLQKLKDDGAIVVHISNRYLDLEPVLARASAELGVPALIKAHMPSKSDNGKESQEYGYAAFASVFVVLTENTSLLEALQNKGWRELQPKSWVSLWTDNYSNIVSIIKFKTTQIPVDDEKEKEAEKKEKTISLP